MGMAGSSKERFYRDQSIFERNLRKNRRFVGIVIIGKTGYNILEGLRLKESERCGYETGTFIPDRTCI